MDPSVSPAQISFGGSYQKGAVKRLTPADYSRAGILKAYDWLPKDREAHDKEMVKYRQYLMKLCKMLRQTEKSTRLEDDEKDDPKKRS
jgi:hypothetical protein